jgi:hypothetical protein
MVQPTNRQGDEGRAEARISLYDKEKRSLVEVVVQDEDARRALARAIEMARVGHGGMAPLSDRFAGMEPDIPVHQPGTFAPSIKVRAAGQSLGDLVGLRGHQPPGPLQERLPRRVLVTPSEIDVASTARLGGSGGRAPGAAGGGGAAVGPGAVGGNGGAGGRAVVPPTKFTDVDPVARMTELPFSGTAEMENCVLLVPHGPHAWRNSNIVVGQDGGYGELRDCPGVTDTTEVPGPASPLPSQAQEGKPKPEERQCKNEEPHQSHIWRDQPDEGPAVGKWWCPGVEPDAEDTA